MEFVYRRVLASRQRRPGCTAVRATPLVELRLPCPTRLSAPPLLASLLPRAAIPRPQARHIRRQGEALAVRNAEVQRACEELLDLAARWPRENAGEVRAPAGAANLFRDYCSRSMYQVGGAGQGGQQGYRGQ